MNDAPTLTLGTAGHIDHGKTALVRALTGVDTDRLPRSKSAASPSRSAMRACTSRPGARRGVDVPGHERFVRTMMSGATGIDLALIVVACDEGVMPQTREHLAILELLGVSTGVVALTKRDLVDDESAELARADVEELLAASAIAGAPIVETSARTGSGLDDLRSALDGPQAPSCRGRPRGRRGPDRPRLHAARYRDGGDRNPVVRHARRRRPGGAAARGRGDARALRPCP